MWEILSFIFLSVKVEFCPPSLCVFMCQLCAKVSPKYLFVYVLPGRELLLLYNRLIIRHFTFIKWHKLPREYYFLPSPHDPCPVSTDKHYDSPHVKTSAKHRAQYVTSSFVCCFVWFIFTVSSLNRWWRRGGGAATTELLRLFHAHIEPFLEDSLCFHPTHRVLERVGVLHCVNLCHRFLNSHYWRPRFPFWLHRRPQGHCHCSGLCSTGDFTSR